MPKFIQSSFFSANDMSMTTVHTVTPAKGASWVSLATALGFLFRYPRLLGWSLMLMVLTGSLTWLGYHASVDWMEQVTGSFFSTAPAVERFWHWPILWGWQALKWIFVVLSRVVAFYLAFLLAYTLTTPGYVFLSTWAGNRYIKPQGMVDAPLTGRGMLIDLVEGLKIGGVGLLVTIAALVCNFVPVLGQATVFCLYVFYSALMFVDFPASRYRWSLGEKVRWINRHRPQAFRLGLLPAAVSMIPLVNIVLMALLFPLFTIQATLNFLTIEGTPQSEI